MRTLVRLGLPCIAVLLLAGCGVRFFYTQLDWLIPWHLRDYVSLDAGQRSALDRRLRTLLDWHCREQLPDYVALLRDVQASLRRGPMDADELERFLQRGEALWDALMHAVTPEAEALLASLDDGQVIELAAAFERRNAETREEFLEGTAEALRERRIERMEKRLRRWFGRLDDAQRARIATWSDTLRPTADDWLAHRVAWQQALLDLLARRADGALQRGELEALLRTPQRRWRDDYRARVMHNRALTLGLLAELANTASPRQRAHLDAEIAGLAGQFERLACVAPSVRPA